MAPNPEQQRLADLPVGPALLVAPAGCGKTEALAMRARAVVERGEVRPPRKVLAVTFSNKARDNLKGRMRTVLGVSWRQRVDVTNFHGLAARVICAHGAVLGIPDDITTPEAAWLNRLRKELGISFRNSEPFESALARAKEGPSDDDEVIDRLRSSGHVAAIAFQERLREERRLDYDDLIRHGARLLAQPQVTRLYQAHFGLVLVDEVQDLTPLQCDMIMSLGADRTTFAGDMAQGIYSWAGADPVGVFARIRALSPTVVEFNQSYRSGPAVLGAVNALAATMGSTQLVCAEPEKWASDAGRVITFDHNDTREESAAIADMIQKILAKNASTTIGVVARRGSRADHLRDAANASDLSFEDWTAPTHVPRVVELLRSAYPHARRSAPDDAERLSELGRLARGMIDDFDSETSDELASALDHLQDQLDRDVTLSDAMKACRVSPTSDAPVAPGLHLLTAHKGKGQEFDWVIILGLEDGHVPDFRTSNQAELDEELRVLHVMASRARYGVAFTYSRHTWTKNGWREVAPSPWLPLLRSKATHAM
jgi:DNA helicase-2/ATP-dependent DNA helicase PcrA